MEQEKVIRVRPARGGWQKYYMKMKRNPLSEVEVPLIVTPEMYENLPSLPEGIKEKDLEAVITFRGRYSDGNVFISSLIQQNTCDEDGYGMEPDDYLCGVVSPDGIFISLLSYN